MNKINENYVIIGALDAEIDEYVMHLKNPVKRTWKEFIVYEGILFNKNVIVAKSGVGKVFAALTTQRLIDAYQPKCVIFSGVAGALNVTYDIGDVVIAEDCIQHDLDATGLGFPRGTIPYTDYRYFQSDEKLVDIALSANIPHTIYKGRILTGDQFLTKKEINDYKYLSEELKGDVIEMEGAAVGLVCTLNEIPFVIIRTIADKANEEASLNFKNFLPEVAANSFHIVHHILNEY